MDDLRDLLKRASRSQREALKRLLDTVQCEDPTPDNLVRGICWLHRNLFEDFYRDVFGHPESYGDILKDILKNLKVSADSGASVLEMEQLISQTVAKAVWEKMDKKQRESLLKEMDKIAKKQGKSAEWAKAGGVSGAILVAELGGFSTYILATSGLAALAGVLGVTLPFAAYTALTTTMGVILGPVGWVGAGLYAILKISGPNYKKLIPAVLYISALRYEIENKGRKAK